jgi:hypothetical protein
MKGCSGLGCAGVGPGAGKRGARLALGQTGRNARKAQARAWALERKRKRVKEADCWKKKGSRPVQMRRLSPKSKGEV